MLKKKILINSLFIYLYLFNNTNVSQYSISLDLKDAIINKQTLETQLLYFQLRLHVSAHLSILMYHWISKQNYSKMDAVYCLMTNVVGEIAYQNVAYNWTIFQCNCFREYGNIHMSLDNVDLNSSNNFTVI